ncbi:Aa_trans domain-containing protein [Mucor velutinosus]|uniref:Aa_trans domain-containing protein n=1 Tax=Mucor velutinosus TaxID=708070 RepID=A0AAN7D3X9_9FUNG|nr:Aa_trans domain-containing protein [Mucor velutinosus]
MSKRGNQNGGNKKKKQKIYHCAKENSTKSHHNKFNVTPGMAGVLVMCSRGKESRAVKEALDVLARYGDTLYPPEENDASEDSNDEDLDLEASIAKEVAALKKPASKKRYSNITTATDCVAFIRINPPVNPSKVVHHMLTELKETQKYMTRYISRFLPVEKTCNAHILDIEAAAKALFEPHFSQKDDQGNLISRKFAVACRVRNCTKIDRMSIINALAATVGPGHKVDLQEPELTIIAEVCQTVCMLSVVDDFNELKRYNVESILGANQKNDAPAVPADTADTTATTSTTKEAESEADKNAEINESS